MIAARLPEPDGVDRIASVSEQGRRSSRMAAMDAESKRSIAGDQPLSANHATRSILAVHTQGYQVKAQLAFVLRHDSVL